MAYKDYFQRRVEENAFGGAFGTGINLKGTRALVRRHPYTNIMMPVRTMRGTDPTEENFNALDAQIGMVDSEFRQMYDKCVALQHAVHDVQFDVGELVLNKINSFSSEQVEIYTYWQQIKTADTWYIETFQNTLQRYTDLLNRIKVFQSGLESMVNDPGSINALAKESGLDQNTIEAKVGRLAHGFASGVSAPFNWLAGNAKWVMIVGLLGLGLWIFGPQLAKKVGGGGQTSPSGA